MKQKHWLLSLLILSPLSGNAWQPTWADNWLIGVSGGYADREGSMTVYNTVSASETPIRYGAYTRNLSDAGMLWGVLVGYQAICNRWLTGVELNADRQSYSSEHAFVFKNTETNLNYDGVARYQRKLMAGLTTRIGYAFRPNFMPYLRGGVEVGDDRFKSYYYTPSVLGGNPAYNEQTAWVYRFLLGIGVELPLVPNCGITLRAEYDYHSKGKTLYNNVTQFSAGTTYAFETQTQPHISSGRISIVWNFF